MQQQTASSIVLPRGLILAASLWLVLSWGAIIGFRTPVQPNSASYTPGVRVMLISIAVGLVVAWPLLRLSQAPTRAPIRQTLLDLAVLLALVQVVIWPLRLVTPWGPLRTAALDATLVAWSLVAGAFVASACGSGRTGPRNFAMLGCLGLCLGGPVLSWASLAVAADAGGVARTLRGLGPLLEVDALSRGGVTPPSAGQWQWIAVVAVAGAAAWVALAAALGRRAGAAGKVL